MLLSLGRWLRHKGLSVESRELAVVVVAIRIRETILVAS